MFLIPQKTDLLWRVCFIFLKTPAKLMRMHEDMQNVILLSLRLEIRSIKKPQRYSSVAVSSDHLSCKTIHTARVRSA